MEPSLSELKIFRAIFVSTLIHTIVDFDIC